MTLLFYLFDNFGYTLRSFGVLH